MFGADFEYWLRQDVNNIEDSGSFEKVINRLESFRNEDLSQEYRQKTQKSLTVDPTGEISGLEKPTLGLDLTPESELMGSIIADEEDLQSSANGAVMHTYNVGRGVREGVQETIEKLGQYDVSNTVLEVMAESPASAIYRNNLAKNAVNELKEERLERGTETSEAMALGLLAAYAEEPSYERIVDKPII